MDWARRVIGNQIVTEWCNFLRLMDPICGLSIPGGVIWGTDCAEPESVTDPYAVFQLTGWLAKPIGL